MECADICVGEYATVEALLLENDADYCPEKPQARKTIASDLIDSLERSNDEDDEHMMQFVSAGPVMNALDEGAGSLSTGQESKYRGP